MGSRLSPEEEKLVREALAELGAKFEPSGEVPAWTCLHIERLTGGAVSRYRLRPDLFPTHRVYEFP